MTRKAKIIIVTLSLLLIAAVAVYFLVLRPWQVFVIDENADPDTVAMLMGETGSDSCNVLGIDIHGDIMTYSPDYAMPYAVSEDIYYSLETAKDDKSIKAVILDIDSYGGVPVAAEEIAKKIKDVEKPVIAVIRSAGTSGAYWVASAADIIFASRLSDIGSIGVSMSYLDESKINDDAGYTWNSLSTGKYKDIGSPEKPLTPEERALLERDLALTHEIFVAAVAENRGLSIERVRELADGSMMMGDMALENGLIDRIGDFDDALGYIASTHNIEPEVCWE